MSALNSPNVLLEFSTTWRFIYVESVVYPSMPLFRRDRHPFVFEQALASATAFNPTPTVLRGSGFRVNTNAAVSAKPTLAVAPKARAGRAPLSVRLPRSLITK